MAAVKKNRENFGGRFGVIVAMAGSAIGLGNMWRFPYLVGQNGGAAFILVYLLMLVFICLPILITEFLLGRRSRSNAFSAFGKLSGKKRWNIIGTLNVLATVCIMSFYCVVGGWSVRYLVDSCTFSLEKITDYSGFFNGFISSTASPLVYTFIFLGLNALIIALGVKKGIERFSKVMMVILFVIIVLVAVRALTLPYAMEGVKYLFVPDFSKIDGKVLVSALGQAFFSLSIGCGVILTYGSYVKDDENIVASASWIAGMDTLFAILAGVAIFPALFAIAGMSGTAPEIAAGPGLVFITLPDIFKSMPLGGLVAILFFLSLLLAAVTSSISQMEAFVAFLIEEVKLSRVKGVIIAYLIYFAMGALCSLSQGTLSGVSIMGNNIFDFMDKLSSNVLMTGGGLLLVLFAGWKLRKEDFIDELSNHGKLNTPAWLLNTIYFLVKFIAPVSIIGVFLSTIL